MENCKGLVRSKTLEQIKTCDVGSWFNDEYPDRARPEYVGLKIPTLREVFEEYGKDVNYYIETKRPALAERMEERLLELMSDFDLRRPAAERWQVLIQSFAPESLVKVHALDPSLPLIQLYFGAKNTSPWIQGTLDAARKYAVGIGPAKDSTDGPLVKAAHEHCLAVHPYTVNEKPEMESLIGLGVDGMFTNFPDRLEEVLGTRTLPWDTAAARAAEASRTCRGVSGADAGGGSGTTGDSSRERSDGGSSSTPSSDRVEILGTSRVGAKPRLGLGVKGVPRRCASSFVARLVLTGGRGGSIRVYVDGRRVAKKGRRAVQVRVACGDLEPGLHRLRAVGASRAGGRVGRTIRFFAR